MGITVLESLADGSPHKLRDFSRNLLREEMPIARSDHVNALRLMEYSLRSLGDIHDRVLARAMNPIRTAMNTVSLP